MDRHNQTHELEKYFVFKFDSNRKLMSVIVGYRGKFFLLTKGADNTVADKSINGKEEQLP